MEYFKKGYDLLKWVVLASLPMLVAYLFQPDSWYYALKLPSFVPVDGVYTLVLPFLCLSIGCSAYLQFNEYNYFQEDSYKQLFIPNLILNALWPVLFFGFHSPILAFICICLLTWCTLLMICKFDADLDSSFSALLLYPYFCWIYYIAMIDLNIILLN